MTGPVGGASLKRDRFAIAVFRFSTLRFHFSSPPTIRPPKMAANISAAQCPSGGLFSCWPLLCKIRPPISSLPLVSFQLTLTLPLLAGPRYRPHLSSLSLVFPLLHVLCSTFSLFLLVILTLLDA